MQPAESPGDNTIDNLLNGLVTTLPTTVMVCLVELCVLTAGEIGMLGLSANS